MRDMREPYNYIKITFDLLLLTVSFLVSSFLAKYRIDSGTKFISIEIREISLFIALCVVWYFSAKTLGLYDEFRSRSFSFEIISVIKCSLIQLLASVIILFVLKTLILSRFFIFIYFTLQLILLNIGKFGARIFLIWLRKKGRNLRFVLIVGAGKVGTDFHNTIISFPHLGYHTIGFLDDQDRSYLGDLYLGTIDELENILRTRAVDDVVIALPNKAIDRIDYVISISENFTINVRIIPDYFKFVSPHFSISIFGDFPIISIRKNPLEELHLRILKRMFDIGISLIVFVLIFSWLWPLLAIAIKISSAGPIFFRQERWGRKNKRIICYKFRSMVKESIDVDEKGKYLQASENDSRVTPFGRFLRKTSLDELPQFLNVLKGEMSIVGPRPHPTPLNIETKDNIRHYMLRHLVKPGITGWAQVNGFRGETREKELMQKRVEYDIWYIENWTLWLDIQIILLTVWKVIKGELKAF